MDKKCCSLFFSIFSHLQDSRLSRRRYPCSRLLIKLVTDDPLIPRNYKTKWNSCQSNQPNVLFYSCTRPQKAAHYVEVPRQLLGAGFFWQQFKMGNDKNRHRQYLPDTAVSLKMGSFNTPSIFRFFKRKQRFFIIRYQQLLKILLKLTDCEKCSSPSFTRYRYTPAVTLDNWFHNGQS